MYKCGKKYHSQADLQKVLQYFKGYFRVTYCNLLFQGQVNTTVTAPGYILSRSKSKMYMYIKTDDFFTEEPGAKKWVGFFY